jgi:hypothetical protein
MGTAIVNVDGAIIDMVLGTPAIKEYPIVVTLVEIVIDVSPVHE